MRSSTSNRSKRDAAVNAVAGTAVLHKPLSRRRRFASLLAVLLLQVSSAAELRMQTQQNTRSTRTLEELLGAFQSFRTAEKPLRRSQSELALAAVLHANKMVASRSPQSTLSSVKRCDVRSSSLPIGIPTYGSLQLPQPALGSASVQSYPAQSGSSSLPVLFKTAEIQAERPPIKSFLYKVRMSMGL